MCCEVRYAGSWGLACNSVCELVPRRLLSEGMRFFWPTVLHGEGLGAGGQWAAKKLQRGFCGEAGLCMRDDSQCQHGTYMIRC